MTQSIETEREQLLKDGFVIRRGMIPPEELTELQEAVEVRVEEVKARAIRERKPDEPEGGFWEATGQPRVGWSADMDDPASVRVMRWALGDPMEYSRQMF